MRLSLSSISVLVLLATLLSAQTTHTVPGSFPAIQAAINAAQSGDTISVAAGIYVQSINFQGKAITVSGAGAGLSVIDGAGQPVVIFDSGETTASVLEGFTIRNGHGDPTGPARWGGGINADNASPTLRDLEVRNCTGAITPQMMMPGLRPGAGGIYLGSSNAIVERCTVHSCSGTYGGPIPGAGGIEIWGGAPTIRDCDIFFNTGGTPVAFGGLSSAGGIGFSAGTVAFVTRTRVRNNTGGSAIGFADSTGAGGVQVVGPASPVLDQCVIVNNVAGGYPPGTTGAFAIGGGGVSVRNASAVLVNCVIRGNQAVAPSPTLSSPPLVAVHTFGSSIALVNSIVRDNLVNSSFLSNVTGTFRHNNTQPVLSGPGNFDADPLWVDPAAGDFHLMPGSPCIDAGDPSVPVPTAFDFDGDPRVVGSAIDVGVDEALPPCARGNVDDGAGHIVPVLDVDGHTVEAVVEFAAPFTFSVVDPPQNPGARFAVFAHVGTPNGSTATPLPFGLGDFCFTGGPQTFLLTTNFSVEPNALVPSTPTPWTLAVPGVPLPFDIAFQGVILERPSELAVTNMVVARVAFTDPPPVITGVTPVSPFPGDTLTVTGTGFHPAAVVCIDGVPVSGPAISPTTITFTAGVVACGATLTVSNPDFQSGATTVNAGAIITGSNVDSGPAAGGNSLVIFGSFVTGTILTIDGQPVTPLAQATTTIIVSMPFASPGPVVVLVTAPNGCTDQFTYTYL